MAKTINDDQINASGNIVAGRDIQAGDKIIEKNIENMNAFFGANFYLGLSPQQYNQLIEEILQKVKCMLEERKKENIIIPERDVFIPAMQVLVNKFEREDIKNMFINLLANSMDKTTKGKVHPSYIESLKNMDSLDAALFKILFNKNKKYIYAINPNIRIKGTNNIFVQALPEWFTDINVDGYNMFQISKSLVNLNRLGLIELMYDRTTSAPYHTLKEKKELNDVLKKYQKYHKDKDLELNCIESVINVTEYGQELGQICLN